jgi:hypothetical protein
MVFTRCLKNVCEARIGRARWSGCDRPAPQPTNGQQTHHLHCLHRQPMLLCDRCAREPYNGTSRRGERAEIPSRTKPPVDRAGWAQFAVPKLEDTQSAAIAPDSGVLLELMDATASAGWQSGRGAIEKQRRARHQPSLVGGGRFDRRSATRSSTQARRPGQSTSC